MKFISQLLQFMTHWNYQLLKRERISLMINFITIFRNFISCSKEKKGKVPIIGEKIIGFLSCQYLKSNWTHHN